MKPRPNGRIASILGRAALLALANGILAGGLTLASLLARDQAIGDRSANVIAVFSLGGGLGGFFAWIVATIVAGQRPPIKRFAAMLVALPVATVSAIEFCYLMVYTHGLLSIDETPLSGAWLVGLAYAGGATLYTLIVSGLPLIMPWAVLPLVVIAFLFARRPRG
jgi:hypothetical protein